ncbi:sodium/potassium-transporting ATPase subunit beta-1-like [Orbicella faveolata]|uniref:sodium/potassium-transporting ATPase subunit beta-1-like n=1 Tax=Orbicella faveolata TaxID=48498 RepID=UPI0009E196A8|nr:sodium/potassium-transporting ATPase subunit beta-1-like [Orbicella faveolata]
MAYAKQGQEGKTRLERFQDTARDFGHFIYNKDGENGEVQVMGRNGKSWAKILVFFFIFYGCLAAFFASMLTIFMTTVPAREEGPKMTRYLAGKPGLIALPAEIVTDAKVSDIVSSINNFLKPYKKAAENQDDKYQNCTEDERVKGSKPCIMDLTALGECYDNSSDFQYGYDEGKPCIFMKLNRVYNWAPEPNDGKDYVELSCKFEEGSSDALSILPTDKPGFPVNFYPFFSEEAWLGPIAAIKVNTTSPVVVLCEALAKNIELSETYRLNRGATGRARIEIKQ